MKKLKWVQQLDDSGCGIACCAMITGQSYAETKAQMLNVYHGGMETRQLLAFLFEQGYYVRRFYKWNMVTETAREGWPVLPGPLCIAAVIPNIDVDIEHVVVVHKGVVYDPATVSIKSLTEYPRVKWILAITKPAEKKKRCRSTSTSAKGAIDASST